VIRRSQRELVRALEKEGLKFTTSVKETSGVYAAADVHWNYMDVPHLQHVHHQVDGLPGYCGDDVTSSILFQRVLWFRIPLVMFLSARERVQTYYMSWLFFILVVETSWEEPVPLRTRTTTRYAIGSPGWLVWVHRWIHRALHRNYDVLMSEDLPMRDRRGELRGWGYKFRSDDPPVGYDRTTWTHERNLDVSAVTARQAAPMAASWDLRESLAAEGATLHIGRADHWGLRVERHGAEARLFARTCWHEGAPLDESSVQEGCVRCPWHGLKIAPLLKIDLQGGPQSALLKHWEVRFADGRLSVKFL
jgi:nitrite reductase/ring-hydroxylating ferredoxin subunit